MWWKKHGFLSQVEQWFNSRMLHGFDLAGHRIKRAEHLFVRVISFCVFFFIFQFQDMTACAQCHQL
jgi:hypothetical protein